MCKVCSLDAESLLVVGNVLKEQFLGRRVRFVFQLDIAGQIYKSSPVNFPFIVIP